MDVWSSCENLLVIRADNIGDVLMSSPAINALRTFTRARITLLTSVAGSEAGRLSADINEVIGIDLPWVKTEGSNTGIQISELIELVKTYRFDGCVIFTVYSQNPLPAAMIAYMAGIPLRLAYCRENPYGLLSNWIPDQEPYHLIRHQVQRDLDLVAAIGANAGQRRLSLTITSGNFAWAAEKLQVIGLDLKEPYLILHPGVSEHKREYPFEKWVDCGKTLLREFNMPVLLTGSQSESTILTELREAIGGDVFVAAGLFSLAEFAAAIKAASVVVSVNTGAVHLAAAMQTPVVVLYAQTNPQHTPWMVPHVVLPYSIEEALRSKNEVIKFVDNKIYHMQIPLPDDSQIAAAVASLLNQA